MGSEPPDHMGKNHALPLSRSRMISFARTRRDESSSLDLPSIHSSMADGTAPEKTSFANAWIRRAVTEPDELFGSGDIRVLPYGGGVDVMVKAIILVVCDWQSAYLTWLT